MNRRPFRGFALVQAAIMMSFALLLGRCAWIALADGRAHAVHAVQQRAVDVVVSRVRGQIFDRNMRLLAGVAEMPEAALVPETPGQQDEYAAPWPLKTMAVVFPALISGPDDALRRLDELIGRPGVLSGSPRAVSLSPAAYAEVTSMARYVRGIVPLSLPSRYSKLASHVVGYLAGASAAGGGASSGARAGVGAGASAGAVGADGIEASYDWALGSDAREVVRLMCDAYGREILGLGARRLTVGQAAGRVKLALDWRLQARAEEALDRWAPGMAGAVVAMDPWTGEVLAMASRPAYDPDDVASYLSRSDAPLINRAVRPYYPGSVFKVVVAAAALSTGVRNPESVYTDTGSTEAGGHVFRCHAEERGGHGDITFQDAFIHSCNTSFIDAATAVGAEPILDFGRALGIGDLDVAGAVRLPGGIRTSGVLPDSRTRLGPADLANLALGQSLVTTTPLEAAVMMCAIANGGLACRPTLVLEVCGPDGRRVTRAAPQAEQSGWGLGERVLRADVAAALREMLAGVASRGTARAALGGMDVAGKTGTAQTGRVDESGAPVFNGWFVGFAPVDAPQLVVAVLVEGPESGAIAAAPVFGDICEYIAGGQRGLAR
jgi:cell division protein FtsI/penicillin-binding protein 2